MMRFMNDYEKEGKMRNMEFSLLFFLTLEMLIIVFGYYTKDTVGILNNNVNEWFYTVWILNLFLASLYAVATNGLNFAMYRVGFRMLHLSTIVYIFYSSGRMAVSTFVIGFCFLEFIYLVIGISNEKMNYPGKWIVKFNESWQAAEDRQNIENARGGAVKEFEIDESDFKEEFTDDLFDYYTAHEDDSFSVKSSPKRRGTYIV